MTRCARNGRRWPAQQPTLRTYSGGLQGDLDIPRPSGNDLSMDQISPLPALTQDEVRVGAWAEVRQPLELQVAPLGRRALAALAPHPGESVLDIGCGGGETPLEPSPAGSPGGSVEGGGPPAAGGGCSRAGAPEGEGARCGPTKAPGVTPPHAPVR